MNQPLSSLDLPKDIITKLKANGFHYCCDTEESAKEDLQKLNIPNLPTFMKTEAVRSAFEMYQNGSNWTPIQTYIRELDTFLIEKLVPGAITELTGFSGAGKTQVCFHLAVGAENGSIFISTNKTLAPHRLREIAQKYPCNAEEALQRIYCVEATEPDELLAVVELLESWLQTHTIQLLIIDSISWPLMQKLSTERTSFVYTVFQNLRKLAHLHHFTIVITNDLTTRVTGIRVQNTPAFGDSFYHVVNNRILLSQKGNVRNAQFLKSTGNGQEEVDFVI